MVLLSLWPGDLLPILKDGFRRSASSALLSSADATQAKGLLTFYPCRFTVGIELGRASPEGGGLPSSPFRCARRVHNSTRATFPEAPL